MAKVVLVALAIVFAAAGQSTTPSSGVSQSVTPSSGVSQPNCTQRLAQCHHLLRLQPVVPIFNPHLHIVTENIDEKCSAYQQAVDCLRPWMDECIKGTEKETMSGWAYTCSDKGRSLLAEASSSICNSDQDQIRAINALMYVCVDGAAEDPQVCQYPVQYAKCVSQATTQQCGPFAGAFFSDYYITFFSTRYPACRSLLSASQSTTPSSGVSQSVTPSSGVSQGTTPSSGVSQSTTASSGVSEGITPSSGVSQSITPSSDLSQSITPSSGFSQSITPSSGVSQSTTPSSGVSQSITPSSGVSQSTTPSSRVSQSTTPSSGVSQPNCTQILAPCHHLLRLQRVAPIFPPNLHKLRENIDEKCSAYQQAVDCLRPSMDECITETEREIMSEWAYTCSDKGRSLLAEASSSICYSDRDQFRSFVAKINDCRNPAAESPLVSMVQQCQFWVRYHECASHAITQHCGPIAGTFFIGFYITTFPTKYPACRPFLSARQSTTPSSGVSQSVTPSSGVSQPNCTQRLAPCHHLLRLQPVVPIFNPQLRTVIENIDEKCSAYQQAVDCWRPSMDECITGTEREIMSGWAYTCSDRGRSLLAEASSSICYSHQDQLRPIDEMIYDCVKGAAESPQVCQYEVRIVECAPQAITQQCGPSAGAFFSEYYITTFSTRYPHCRSLFGARQSITPSSGVSQSITPSNGVSQSITPSSGFSQSTTPSSGVSQSITPSSGVSQSTTPSSGVSQSKTPSSGVSQSTTPSSGVSQPNCAQRLAPCHHLLRLKPVVSIFNPQLRTLTETIDEKCSAYQQAVDCLRPSTYECITETEREIMSGWAYTCSHRGRSLLAEASSSICYSDPDQLRAINALVQACMNRAAESPQVRSVQVCQFLVRVVDCASHAITQQCLPIAGVFFSEYYITTISTQYPACRPLLNARQSTTPSSGVSQSITPSSGVSQSITQSSGFSQSITPSSGVSQSTTPSSGVSQPNCAQRLAQCVYLFRLQPVVSIFKPQLRTLTENIEETCSAYQQAIDCVRPWMDECVTGSSFERENIFGWAYTCSDRGRSLLAEASSSICYSDPDQLRAINAMTYDCMNRAAESPEVGSVQLCQHCMRVEGCAYQALTQKCGQSVGSFVSEHYNTTMTARLANCRQS